MKSPAFALAILLSTLAGPAWAADLWLEPARFRFEASGGRVGVRAQLGTPRSARPQLRRAARAQGLWVQGPQGWLEAPGKSGDDPIGMASLRGDGAHLLAYRGKRGFGRLGNEGWLRLFRETGRDVADAPTHVTSVLYQRSAKALVLAGPPRGAPWLKALGLELELIPLAAPHELADAPGGLASLPLRLVWRGQPQVGVELRAWPLDGAKLKEAITATTDKRGQASIRLTRRGAWVVCATALRKGDLTRHEVGFTSFSFSADPAPPAPGPAALARALRTARRRGVLAPLLGTHYFTFDRIHREGGKEVATHEMLMTYTLSIGKGPRNQETFRVAVDVSPRGTPHGIEFEYAVGLDDGQFRWLTNSDGRFAPEGSRLKTANGPRTINPKLLLPKVVGVFLAPQLGLAVPGELPHALRLVDLTPFATLSRPLLLRPARAGEPDFAKEFETWVTEEGQARPTTRVRAARAGPFKGKLIQIRTRSYFPGRGDVRQIKDCNRLTQEAYRARWIAWFGDRK